MQGIPLIAWPLFVEQRMNAVLLTKDLNVALRPKANKKKSGGSRGNGNSYKESYGQTRMKENS